MGRAWERVHGQAPTRSREKEIVAWLRSPDGRAAYAAERHRRDIIGSLDLFVREAWEVIEPGTELVWNWHIDAICEHLEAVTDGRIRRLIINIPPGHMKSLLVSVFWPAWMWLRRPSWRLLAASYGMDLSIRDNMRMRDVIRSKWYRSLVPSSSHWEIKSDRNNKIDFGTSEHGARTAASVGGRLTGLRGDAIIIDDPTNMSKGAPSAIDLRDAREWFGKAVSTRLNDLATGAIVVIMQRLADDDLTGHILDTEPGEWDHLELPTEYDPDRHCSTSIGWEDPRINPGELLFEHKFPERELRRLRRRLGPTQYAAQHQQQPVPADGNLIKKHWIKRFETLPAWDLFDEVIISLDANHGAKDRDKGDRSAATVLMRMGANFYVIPIHNTVDDLMELVASVKRWRSEWAARTGRPAIRIVIEDKANGRGVLQLLRTQLPGLIPYDPGRDSKTQRLTATLPIYEAGNVWFAAEGNRWHDALTETAISQLLRFPAAKYDDMVDAITQGLLRWLRLWGRHDDDVDDDYVERTAVPRYYRPRPRGR